MTADGIERATTPDGTTVFVDTTHAERGSEGPFEYAFLDADCERRWGFRCGACGALDVAVDPMGRVVCNRCPNRRKPDEWDAAHE